jgi:hypothetical protein
LTIPNWFTGETPESTFSNDIECDVPTGAEFIEDDTDGCKDGQFFTAGAKV